MNMLDTILDIFRKRKIKKFLSDVPTGLRPLREISTVNVIIDVEEPGFDLLKEDILAWGRANSLKVNIYSSDSEAQQCNFIIWRLKPPFPCHAEMVVFCFPKRYSFRNMG